MPEPDKGLRHTQTFGYVRIYLEKTKFWNFYIVTVKKLIQFRGFKVQVPINRT